MHIKFERKNISIKEFEFIYSNDSSVLGDFKKNKLKKSDQFESFKIANVDVKMSTPTFFSSIKSATSTKQEAKTLIIANEQCHLYYCGKKGTNFLNGISFWTITYQGREYTFYEVGKGHKGIYLYIWENENIVAISSKHTHSKHFGSEYDLYFENQALPLELVLSINLCWDLMRYWPDDSSEVWYTLNTWQKELKNKYDPDFIPRIKELDSKIMRGISS